MLRFRSLLLAAAPQRLRRPSPVALLLRWLVTGALLFGAVLVVLVVSARYFPPDTAIGHALYTLHDQVYLPLRGELLTRFYPFSVAPLGAAALVLALVVLALLFNRTLIRSAYAASWLVDVRRVKTLDPNRRRSRVLWRVRRAAWAPWWHPDIPRAVVQAEWEHARQALWAEGERGDHKSLHRLVALADLALALEQELPQHKRRYPDALLQLWHITWLLTYLRAPLDQVNRWLGQLRQTYARLPYQGDSPLWLGDGLPAPLRPSSLRERLYDLISLTSHAPLSADEYLEAIERHAGGTAHTAEKLDVLVMRVAQWVTDCATLYNQVARQLQYDRVATQQVIPVGLVLGVRPPVLGALVVQMSTHFCVMLGSAALLTTLLDAQRRLQLVVDTVDRPAAEFWRALLTYDAQGPERAGERPDMDVIYPVECYALAADLHDDLSQAQEHTLYKTWLPDDVAMFDRQVRAGALRRQAGPL